MHKLEQYLKNHPKKQIIFDLDETILRLELPWKTFVDKAWQMFDAIDHDLVVAHPHTTTRTNQMMNIIIAEHGKEAAKKVYDHLEFFENHYLDGVTPNPGLIEWIKANKNKYAFHIWTSQMARSVDNVLQIAKITDLFASYVSRDMVKFAKPYTDGFEIISKDKGLEKSDYLMVGDSEFDEGAARNAGIDFFFEDFFKK